MEKDIAVYVSSYDGCSDLWDTFFDLLDIYWKDCKYNIFLINNQADYERKGVNVIHTGEEKNWFHRTLVSLEQLSEEYVLFLLEDYFVSKNIENREFDIIVNYMKDNGIYFYRLSDSNLKDKTNEIVRVPAGTNYAVSLQPAVWERKKLIQFLREIDEKSPWDFEVVLNETLIAKDDYFEGICYDTRDILGYKNGVLRGKWIPETIKFYKEKQYVINTGSRAILPQRYWFRYKFALWAKAKLPRSVQIKIKTLLKKFNIKYV